MAMIKCPECGQDISNQTEACPHCGYSLMKKQGQYQKRRTFAIIGAIVLIMLLVIYYQFIYKGTFKISQSSENLELGSNIDLVQCLEYNPQDITEITIISNDNFNINEIGDYTVTFSVKNKRGNIKEIPLEFHVIDTVAPKLSIINDVIYVPQGKDYNPQENISVQDNDEYDVDVNGTYDINKEGEYEISFTAKDKSGNTSETQSMLLIVENRDNCIFRNICFGDSLETIKRYETAELLEESAENGGYMIYYEDVVEGEDAYIGYYLNDKDELYNIAIAFIENHTDNSIYINNFSSITEKLTQKYGEPKVEKGKGSLYDYCSTEAQALSLGEVKYRNIWNTEDSTIILFLGSDNYQINFALVYESKTIEQPNNSDIN